MDNPIPMPSGLVVKKGANNRVICCRADSRPGIGDGHQNLAGLRERRLNHQPPGLVFDSSPSLPCH